MKYFREEKKNGREVPSSQRDSDEGRKEGEKRVQKKIQIKLSINKNVETLYRDTNMVSTDNTVGNKQLRIREKDCV